MRIVRSLVDSYRNGVVAKRVRINGNYPDDDTDNVNFTDVAGLVREGLEGHVVYVIGKKKDVFFDMGGLKNFGTTDAAFLVYLLRKSKTRGRKVILYNASPNIERQIKHHLPELPNFRVGQTLGDAIDSYRKMRESAYQ